MPQASADVRMASWSVRHATAGRRGRPVAPPPAPLREREDEIGAISGARAGEGSIAMIEAAAGCGKGR